MANAPVTTIGVPTIYTSDLANPEGEGFFTANTVTIPASPPTIENTVAPDSPLSAAYVDVVDADGFVAIILMVQFGSDDPVPVHIYAGAFDTAVAPYSVTRTVTDADEVRWSYTIRRAGGWPREVATEFSVMAIDALGALA